MPISKKYSSKQLLFLSLAVILFSIIINILMSIFFIKKTQYYEQYQVNFYHISKENFHIEIKTQEFLRNNLLLDITNTDSVNLHIDKTKHLIEQLEKVEQKKITKKLHLNSDINKIITEIDDFLALYKEISILFSELYDTETGLKIKKNNLQNKIIKNDDFNKLSLNIHLQKLILSENMLLSQQIQLEIFIKEYTQIINNIKLKDTSNVYNKYVISKFSNEIAEYKDIVINIYMKKNKIGFSKEEGLFSKINEKNVFISHRIQTIIKILDEQQAKKINFYIVLLIIFNLIIMSLLLVFLFFVFRNIFKQNKSYIEIKEQFNNFKENLLQKNDYLKKIIAKDFDFQIDTKNNSNVINETLKKLRNNLQKEEKESRQLIETENQQKWISAGLTSIGTIMRQNTDSLIKLNDKVLKEIIEYIDAAQGAFYLYYNESPKNQYLELSASYGYGKEKEKSKKINLYEGLIGTVAVEKKYMFFDKIPEGYIYLTTGYGSIKPRSLIIFPLIVENELFGVIELASFNTIQKFEIDFLIKLSEEIALTISYVRISEQTNKLLQQTKLQAKKLKIQEQNLIENQKSMEENFGELLEKLDKKDKEIKTKENIIFQKTKDIQKKDAIIKRLENKISTKD